MDLVPQLLELAEETAARDETAQRALVVLGHEGAQETGLRIAELAGLARLRIRLHELEFFARFVELVLELARLEHAVELAVEIAEDRLDVEVFQNVRGLGLLALDHDIARGVLRVVVEIGEQAQIAIHLRAFFGGDGGVGRNFLLLVEPGHVGFVGDDARRFRRAARHAPLRAREINLQAPVALAEALLVRIDGRDLRQERAHELLVA